MTTQATHKNIGLAAKSRNQRKKRGDRAVAPESGGERGIRTLGTLRYTAFPVLHNRPLCHLSVKPKIEAGLNAELLFSSIPKINLQKNLLRLRHYRVRILAAK